MKYFTIPSLTFADALAKRKGTTIHFFKLTSRIAIVWDRSAK